MGRGVRCNVQVSVEGCQELFQCLVVLPCILKYDLGCGRYRDRGIEVCTGMLSSLAPLKCFLKWGGGTIIPFFGAPWVGHVLFRLRINLVLYKAFFYVQLVIANAPLGSGQFKYLSPIKYTNGYYADAGCRTTQS